MISDMAVAALPAPPPPGRPAKVVPSLIVDSGGFLLRSPGWSTDAVSQ